MATHDYNIANQGFPAFRADLNDALAAIVSNNSNATAPATTFAHMLWVDTAANPSVLKIRNADNDAWITIGTIDQTGDTFTLTSAVSATTLNTSGQVVFNDAGADVDFRVEGDTDANLVFVDASTDRVGVGTNSPAYKFDVNGQIRGDTFVRATSGSVGTFIVANSGGFGVVGTPTNHPLVLLANDIERARVTTDGYLRMASGTGGIQFGGDTAAANALDDYEEGTWTPTALGETTAGTTTYTTQEGSYTKIGRQVTVSCRLGYSALTGTGNLRIAGFPFSAVNGTMEYSSSVMVNALNWSGGTYLVTYMSGNQSDIALFYCADDAGWNVQNCVNESANFIFTMTYFTA